MNTALKLGVSLVILGMTAVALIGFQMAKSPLQEKPNEKQVPLVSTYTAKKFSGTLDLSFTGEVIPYRVITKSTEVAGRIMSKSDLCRPGRTVQGPNDDGYLGDTLIEIDLKDYELEIKRLTAEVAQSQAMIDELADEISGAIKSVEVAQREYDLLEREFQRRKDIAGSLSKTDLTSAERNAITAQKALISAENNLKILQTRKARMNAALSLSNSMLEKAQLDKSRSVIRAPISGVIVESDVEAGDYVTKGAAVFTIEDTSRSEILCSLKLEQLDWLWENLPPGKNNQSRTAYQPPNVDVTIKGDVGEQTVTWTGTLDRYDGIGLDEATKSVPCIIVVKQPVAETDRGNVALVRGMFVEVTVEYEYRSDTNESSTDRLVQFPARAIQPGNYVWLDNNGKMAKRNVEVVDFVTEPDTGKRYAIVRSSGENAIAPGEQIIDSPIANPTENAELEVVNRDNQSESQQNTGTDLAE